MSNQYKKGTVMVMLRMPEEMKNRVDAAAKLAGLTISELSRSAILAQVEVIEKLFQKKQEKN